MEEEVEEMTMRKTMNLPFAQESLSEDLISTLTVTVQANQGCEDCMKEAGKSPELWTLSIEARKGDFTRLLTHLYCPECARSRLAQYNRVRECGAELGDVPAAEACADRKSAAEGETEEEEDDGEFED